MMPTRINGKTPTERAIVLRGGPHDGKEIFGIADDVTTLEFFPAAQREPRVTRYSYARTLEHDAEGRAVFAYRVLAS